MMSKSEQAIRLVRSWALKIGPHEARKRLVLRDLAPTTATLIVSGRYVSTPTPVTANILLEEMAKDGITLTDVIAS